MRLEGDGSLSSGETVMVVMDADKSRGNVDALDWAVKHVVRPGYTLLVLGILCVIDRKTSCFPFQRGKKIELLREGEVDPTELEEEIIKKREEYKSSLQPFYRQCKKNEVGMKIKIAAGFCPRKVTIEEAQNCNACWIVLDSHLKKDKTYIYGQVSSNLALVKGKDMVTLMPSKASQQENYPLQQKKFDDAHFEDDNTTDIHRGKSIKPPPKTPCWHPLSWKTGFPRCFSQGELEMITCGFSEENTVHTQDNVKVYRGLFQELPVMVECFSGNDERFWSTLKILSRVRHRNIMNIVGYCIMGSSMFMLFDFPFMGSLETNLQCDYLAEKIPWKARWYIAVEIGACLRYLHEECVDGPIVHLSVSSNNVIYSLGCSAMLANFTTARCSKDDASGINAALFLCQNLQEDECLASDVHDYGMFLLELITGRSARCFQDHTKDLIDWALPAIEDGSISKVKDPRLTDVSEDCFVHQMAEAAMLCLLDSCHRVSMSEKCGDESESHELITKLHNEKVLAVVRGHQVTRTKSENLL